MARVYGITSVELDELRDLEEAMWRAETRGDPVWMDAHLAPGFTEFGRSGRRYSREDVLDADVDEIDAVFPLPDLVLRQISDEVVLVTYRGDVDGEQSHRSSVWRRASGAWLMEFHQGTPAPTA